MHSRTIKVLGKRNKERLIPLTSTAVESIKNYIKQRDELTMHTDHLLLTSKGNKIYETLVYRVINNYFSNVSTKTQKSPAYFEALICYTPAQRRSRLKLGYKNIRHSSLASTQVYTHSSLDQIKKVYNKAHPRSDKNQDL